MIGRGNRRRVLKFSGILLLSSFAWEGSAVAQQQGSYQPVENPLVRVLQAKGILTAEEVTQLSQASSAGVAEQNLAKLLLAKGIISQNDYDQVSATGGYANTNSTNGASPNLVPRGYRVPGNAQPGTFASASPPSTEITKKAPTMVPAVAPVRVLPLDAPKTDGLIPGIKLGAVTMTPYGFIKATGIQDSSSPNGDDFPFVGLFLTTTNPLSTGPTTAPEFHLKARSTRFGANFEWPDMTKKLTLTGRIEGDFEGNFSEVDNRDVSSIRSNEPQLRLAFVRMDYHQSDTTDLFFKAGQDWTLFGSSVLPNLLETTFLGAYYGVIWERSPQFTFGVVRTLNGEHNVKFLPEFGIMMPSSGQILKLGSLGLEAQLGEGEREGADSGRAEIEARTVLQFQLDKAEGVAPAQVLWSGFEGKRTSLATTPMAFPADATAAETAAWAAAAAAFPNGFTSSSTMYGNQIAAQLPTRWFTLSASAYRGGDLRFFFGGQVNSYYTDLTGLPGIPVTFTTVDGGPLTAAGSAVVVNGVVAPQRPVRSFGGFVNLGLPVSRWLNARPESRMAGWQIYLHTGKDQVVHRDLTNPGAVQSETDPFVPGANLLSPLPLLMGKVVSATVYYKLNRWATFGFEQSIYSTRLEPGVYYSIAGIRSNEWQDHRTEFGPIFSF